MIKTIMPALLLSTFLSVYPSYAVENAPIISNGTVSTELNTEITYFISLNGLKVRAVAEDGAKSLGTLLLNDKVKLINPNIVYNQRFIEITILKSVNNINPSDKYFIDKNYLSTTLIDYKTFTGKYFAVVNVASETLRLYERTCLDSSCPNKMILETEIVVGEDRNHPAQEPGKGRSVLGSYRVTGWSKFYEDANGHYPAWYRDGYPDLPPVGNGGTGWLSGKVMPKDELGKKHGVMRGAFGWYTAFTAPEAYGQWTHGTIGWGIDKDTMVKRTKKTLINVLSDPRSSGCTRNNNEAIAYIRYILNVGAPIIKIYAKEAILDRDLRGYSNQTEPWSYILTTVKSHTIQREEVLKLLGISSDELNSYWDAKHDEGKMLIEPSNSLSQILEIGTYDKDVHPDASVFIPGEKLGSLERKTKMTGNVYGVKSQNMQGTFYVDAGVLSNYAHPTEILEISGFKDEVTPPWMLFEKLGMF